MKDVLNALADARKQLLFILVPKQKIQCIWILGVIFIGSFVEMLGITAILPFIQAVLDPVSFITMWKLKPFFDRLNIRSSTEIILFLGIVIIAVYIIKNLYLLASSYIQIKFKLQLQKDLSILMLRTYMRRPYSFFLNVNSAYIIRGINDDVYGVYAIIENCFKILTESITFLLIGIFIIMTDAFMAIGAIAIAGLCFISITIGMRKRMSFMGKRQREVLAKQNKYAYQAINGIKEIMVMQRNEEFIKQYEDAYEIKRKTDVAYYFAQAVPERIIEGVCISGIIGMVCIRIMLGIEVTKFIPQLAAFAVAFFRILPSVSRLAGYFSALVFFRPTLCVAYENIKAARDYEEYLKNYSLSKKYTQDEYEKKSFSDELTVEDISWKYENSQENVLNNLSIHIKKGESVAFIGASGSGKTTLADIILGLLQPQIGSVYVDGVDIFTIKKAWSDIIGYVPQTVFLIDDSIRANIAFGLAAEEWDDAKIWRALNEAQLKSFVEQLPDRLDTVVGERGVRLSGGQRQRIAIARALYHNPEIFVLDEATSALDSETETAVMEAIELLQGRKTLIIVAHRLTTIKNCDKIYEIKNGEAFLRDKKDILGGNV